MRIGELATKAKINIQTIRFYEREGLLRKPLRTAAGYRSYETRDLEQVQFIRVCQSLGFSLREIEQLMGLHRVMSSTAAAVSLRPAAVQEILAMARERIASMEEKIEALSKMRTDLLSVAEALRSPMLATCPASKPTPTACPEK